jgi:hypothetical protein
MPPVVFEPTILASERPKTHALDRTATGSAADSNSGSPKPKPSRYTNYASGARDINGQI